jgi:NDP-hexose-3-ketoreductase
MASMSDSAGQKKIRIGVLGCAGIAQRYMIPAILDTQDLELVAVASRAPGKARAYADRFGGEAVESYENLLNRRDIDAVYVPLPTGLHEQWILRALQERKHVFAEKSLAMNVTSAQRMLNLARENRLVLMEDFMYRYHSQHRFVFDQLQQGVIGELRMLRSYFAFPPLDPHNFRYDKALGGGAILDAAAYTVDVSRWFMGNDLELGFASLFYDRLKEVCIRGSALLYSPATGLSALIAFGFDNYYQCNYELWGNKGIIHCDRSFTPPPDFTPTVRIGLPEGMQEHILPADNHFKNILKEFVDCIRQRQYAKHHEDLLSQSRLLTALQEKGRIQYTQ